MFTMQGESAQAVVAIVLFASFSLYWTADALAGHWRKAKTSEHAAALKQQMIEKGFTGDDIVRVLAAESDAVTATAGETSLAAALIEGGYEAEAVADITHGIDAAPAGLRDPLRAAVANMVENSYDGNDILKFIARRVESAGTVSA